MAGLTSSTIAASYDQLLIVDNDGGGNSTTHVAVKDGDGGTTFPITVATDAIMITSTNRLEFGDDASYIHQSADGVLDLVSDTEIEINATTIDINGAVDVSSTVQTGGAITISTGGSNAQLFFDTTSSDWYITNVEAASTLNFYNGSTDVLVIGASSATFAGNIIIDADDKGLVLGADQDASIHSSEAGAIIFTRGTDLTPTSDDTEGWAAFYIGNNAETSLQIYGGEGGASSLYMYSDTGDDNDDKFAVTVNGGEYIIKNYTNGSWEENIVIDSSADSIRLLNANVYIGDSSNANMTQGLTIQQAANDDQILAFKSSDVAHGRTSYAETDTYASFSKQGAAYGGLNITSIMEDNSSYDTSMQIVATGGQASTSAAYNEAGLVSFRVEEHDGNNGLENVTSGGNVFSVRALVGGANRTAFNVTEAGAISYDGSDAGAFDYAEMFEWKDGNPDNEERHGYSVVLDGDKIRKAEDGETPIGIVSVRPAVCGDNPNGWYKTFKMDEWGRNIDKEVKAVKFEIQHESEPATYYQEGDELPEGKKVGDEKTAAVYTTKEKHYRGDAIPDDLPDDAEHYTILQRQHSDEYDESKGYTMRNKRKEWSPVGLMGKLRMHKGQPTASSWIKMKDEGNDIEMWLVK